MSTPRAKAPTIFGRRMRRPKYAAAGTYTLHAGELSISIWRTWQPSAQSAGKVYPFCVDFGGDSADAVAAAIETWLVKQLFGKTLGALGFEVRRARS